MGYLQVLNLMVKAYKAARGVMPKGLDLLKLKMKARQKVIDSKKVVEFPKERITNPFKPRPEGIEKLIKKGDVKIGQAPKTTKVKEPVDPKLVQQESIKDMYKRLMKSNREAIKNFKNRNKPRDDKANGGSPNLPFPFFFEGTRPGGSPLPSLDYYDDDHGVKGLMKKRKKKKKKRDDKATGGIARIGFDNGGSLMEGIKATYGLDLKVGTKRKKDEDLTRDEIARIKMAVFEVLDQKPDGSRSSLSGGFIDNLGDAIEQVVRPDLGAYIKDYAQGTGIFSEDFIVGGKEDLLKKADGGLANLSQTYDTNPTLQSQFPDKQDYLDLFSSTTTTTPQTTTYTQMTEQQPAAGIPAIKPIVPIIPQGDGDSGVTGILPRAPKEPLTFRESMAKLNLERGVPVEEEEISFFDKIKQFSPTYQFMKAGKKLKDAGQQAIDNYFAKKQKEKELAAKLIAQQNIQQGSSGGPGEGAGTFGASINEATGARGSGTGFSDYT